MLKEYDIRNIFVEKSYTKCGGETISWPFSKKSILGNVWINSLKKQKNSFKKQKEVWN